MHGAIDGYSRKILWLELSRCNSKPEMPAKYYLDGVKRNMVCPILLRTDCGTEMVSWLPCSAIFVKMGLMNFLVRMHTSMDLHQPINGLKAGGHFSEGAVQAGG